MQLVLSWDGFFTRFISFRQLEHILEIFMLYDMIKNNKKVYYFFVKCLNILIYLSDKVKEIL